MGRRSIVRNYYSTEKLLKLEYERNSIIYTVQFKEGIGKFTRPFKKDGKIIVGAFYRVPIVDDGVKWLRLA